MNENNNPLNSSSTNSANLNNPNNQPNYPNYNEINQNIELNWHANILNSLNIITQELRERRFNEDNASFVNLSSIFLVSLFIGYMLYRFIHSGGLEYERLCILLGMILSVFILVVLLHRHEVRILKRLNKEH